MCSACATKCKSKQVVDGDTERSAYEQYIVAFFPP